MTIHTSGQNCEYVAYFRLTDLAIKECKKENFKEAKKNFKLAFEKTVFPQGHDLSYALFTANKLKDDQWSLQVAKKLAEGGIPLKYFAQFKKKKWYKEFQANFHKYDEHYKEHFDLDLKNRFLDIYQKDFERNQQYHEWREGKIELTLQELIDGATQVTSEFKEFIDEYGFPSEQKMGYNYVRRINRIEEYSSVTLLIHVFQIGDLTFKDRIDDFTCSGGIHSKYNKTLHEIRGFGNGTGIKQEMETRYTKYRGAE